MPENPIEQQSPFGSSADNDTVFLPAAKVRGRYNVSDMSIWRWCRDDSLKFPEPIRINGRRFWRLSELEIWEKSREDS
jgi:predicted DNA-binding transcriptional regulator AlpA